MFALFVSLALAPQFDFKIEPAKPEHVAFIIPRKRLLVFLGSDAVCVPCRLTRAELRKLNRWQVGSQPTGHIQIVDVETDQSSLRQYAVTSTPTFILVESGQVTYRREGFLDFRTIAGIYNKEMPGQVDRTRRTNP